MLYTFIYLTIAVLVVAFIYIKFNYYHTRPIKENRDTLINSMTIMEKVRINTYEQMLLIRSKDISNNILLFVHGGPGSPDMASMRYYQPELENHYTVVTWDQRGCGKSIQKNTDYNSFTIDLFISDLIEVIKYLIKIFDKKKIILVGHSWGSILGLKIAMKHPELIKAFVSVSQVVDMNEGEAYSYQIAMEKAKKDQNKKIIDILESLGAPKYGKFDGGTKAMTQERDALLKLGLLIKNNNTYIPMVQAYIKSSEFCFKDLVTLKKAAEKTTNAMWNEILATNFLEEKIDLTIPVFFISGKDDCVTPCKLTEKLYSAINCSQKEHFILDDASHFPFIDKPEEFRDIMLKIDKKLN